MVKIIRFLFVFLVSSMVFAQEADPRFEALNEAFHKGSQIYTTDKIGSYEQFNKALNIAISLNDYQSQLDILAYLTYANGYHYDLENYRINLLKSERILYTDSLNSSIDDIDSYINAFLLDKANYHFKTKEYTKAKGLFKQLQATFDIVPHYKITSRDDADMLFSINNFLATIYKHEAKYELSEQFYLRNLDLVEKSSVFINDKQSRSMNINQLLAQLYNQMGQYQKANTLLIKALETYKEEYSNDKKFKNTLITIYQKLTENYMLQDDTNQATVYLTESKSFLNENDPFHKKSMLLIGDIHLAKNDLKLALDAYNTALASYSEFRNEEPHQDIAEVYGKIANLNLRNADYRAGLEAIIKALNNAGQNISIIALDQNPAPENVFSKKQLLYLLDLKIQHLSLAYEQEGDSKYLNYAVNTIGTMLQTFDLLKREFESKLDKQFLAKTAYPIFHRMLAITHEAYQETPTTSLFELALEISEKNKDFLLLEALRNANASEYGNVPKEVVEKEAQFRSRISHIERKIFDSANQKENFSEALFILKQEYYSFLDTLKLSYPKYHDLKYQSKNLGLATIRSRLIDNEGLLLSFTVTDKALYTLVLDKSHEKFLKVSFDESNRKEVASFYKLISTASIKDTKEEMVSLAKAIFDKVLKKPLIDFKGTNLTIVADDVLHYLPFDLLQENDSLLLQRMAISYANSLTSLLELKAKKSNNGKKLLAFAPSFDDKKSVNKERQFGKLRYTIDEVNGLDAFYTSEIFSGSNATLINFMTQAPKFNSIHLATHASANDEFPDFSYMAFAEDGINSNTLYIKDLYTTTLDADMVVLSACQTGIGKLQKGQGMLSLSKGFYYAGAKSLVTTLWKINDKSTVKLMEYFYEALSRGKSKKEALRLAKLKYLETTDDDLLKHPYYWAAFTVSGDTNALSSTANYWWWLLLIPVVVIAVAYRKKRI